MKKKIKIDSKVQIQVPSGYMQEQYANKIGTVINIKDDGFTLVQYSNGIKLNILTANLNVL